ncbi:F-box/kelch-repeat protein At3g06240-like isoform X1 [Vicia villosa]|uniref:F-box/kelch-repeat protein At3g06240-like isoform X1 n=1 Tax=Vicia villosa TaxID=3911 RepID=UPI00273B2B10|nr:F-box/kelch-repeat protein At3g06240-like isoform X1 [Vicia villosa]
MYSVAVPHGVTVHKGNKTSESKIEYEELVSIGSFLKSMRLADEKEEEEYGSRSYTPLSLFYTKGKSRKNYLPLSFFTTIVPMDMDNSPVLFGSYEEALMSDGSKSSVSESKMGPMEKGNKSESKMFLTENGNKSESKMDPMENGNKSESKMSLTDKGNKFESKMGPMEKGNKSSQSKMFLTEKGNKSESKMSPMEKGNKSESKMSLMDKGKSSQSKVSRNNSDPMDQGESSQSKFIRNSIPDKLALSILSKLPIKSLKRFGCIRKSWSILFENSDFMTMYTNSFISHHVSDDDYHTFILSNHHATAYHLTSDYLYNSEFHLLNNTVKFNLPPPFQQSGCHRRILNSASVKGIFCLHQEYPINLQYVLWNPATQEFLVIPRSPADLLQDSQNNLHLSHAFNGFGYDQLRDDFKVIQYITFDCECESYRPPIIESYFEIYSLKSNSWRTIDMNKDPPSSIWCRCGLFDTREVYLDGACHWVISDGEDLAEKSLLSFDLSDEVFLTTPIGVQPPLPYSYDERLAVLNGSIALISNYHDDIIFHIYILGELGVGESWIKLYIYGPFSSITWPPVGFGKSGYIFFPKNDYELAYVDLSTQKIEEVGITGAESSYFQVGLYKESLLSIGGSIMYRFHALVLGMLILAGLMVYP